VPIPDVGTVQCQHVEREATDRRTTSRGSRSQASKSHRAASSMTTSRGVGFFRESFRTPHA
jgi:hypothetical protein